MTGYGGYIRLDRVSYLLGITLLGLFVAYQIRVDPITWDSAVAIGLFLIAVVPGLIIWGKKCYRKRTLFKPEYQHSQKTSSFSLEVEASEKEQRVQLTLRMTLDTHVEFVAVLFDGQGTLPVIKRLDDWQWKNKPHYVDTYALPDDPEGRWYWRYETPEHRLMRSRITIGIEFLATDYFDGYLITRLTCIDGNKEQKLPFKVRKRAGPDTHTD